MQPIENQGTDLAESLGSLRLGEEPPSKVELSDKMRDKLQNFARWRIDSSSIEFPGDDAREFRGGYASVSKAVLVIPSTLQDQDNNVVEGGKSEAQEEVSKHGDPKPSHRTFERKSVAVKKMKVENNADVERVLGLALREAKFLADLSHPRIMKLEGFVEDVTKNVIWLVSPWEENGNLKDFIAQEDWEIPERISLINDVARGLEYLHSQEPPICHGDLKSLNILVNSEYFAVITDFGSARRLGTETSAGRAKQVPRPGSAPATDQENAQVQAEFCATTNTITLTCNNYTIRWAAPELLRDEDPCLGSDIWAFGWIAYEVMTNTIPFHDVKSENLVVNRVVRGALPSITNDTRMSLIRALCVLMVQCWSVDPEKRPTAESCRKLMSLMPMIAPAPRQAMDADTYKTRNGQLLYQLGVMYNGQGDYSNALDCFNKALDIQTSSLSTIWRAHILRGLTSLHMRRGDYDKAVSFGSEALQICTNADERGQRADALSLLANIHRFKGENDASIKLHSEALQIRTKIGDNRGRAISLHGLALVHMEKAEWSQAAALYSEALPIFTNTGDQRSVAIIQRDLGDIRRGEGDLAGAINTYSDALEVLTNIGDQRERSITLDRIGLIRSRQGKYNEAIECHSDALRIDTETGDKAGRAASLWHLAEAHRKLDHHSEAISLYLESSKAYGEIGNSKNAATTSRWADIIRKSLPGAV